MYTKFTVPATGAHTLWTVGMVWYVDDNKGIQRRWIKTCMRRNTTTCHFALGGIMNRGVFGDEGMRYKAYVVFKSYTIT